MGHNEPAGASRLFAKQLAARFDRERKQQAAISKTFLSAA